MKRSHNFTLGKALFVLIAFIAAASSASATVLTFDITGATDGIAMPQAYGDRVMSDGWRVFIRRDRRFHSKYDGRLLQPGCSDRS